MVALAILAVLAVTISAILIYGGWQRTRGFLYLEETRVRSLAESGIHDALAELAANPEIRYLNRHLTLDSANQISYSIRPWGAFLQVQSTGIGRRLTRAVTALVGTEPPRIFDHVLSPLESRYLLVVSGRTRIHGDVYVGAAGLTQGEINGRGFEGDQLVFGEVDTLDSRSLPRFSSSLLREFLDSLNELKLATSCGDLALVFAENRDRYNDLGDDSPVIRTRAAIEFNLSDSVAWCSPCCFFSDQSIQVTGRSRLNGVVLCAPEVVISDEAYFKEGLIVADHAELSGNSVCSGQIVVRDTLRILANASLVRPSLVILRGRQVEERMLGAVEVTSQGLIESSFVNGARWIETSAPACIASVCGLHISRQSRIVGMIWWEGRVELEGTFAGAAAVSFFTHHCPPTTYMNWLVDSRIEFADVRTCNAFPLVFTVHEHPRLHSMREGRSH